MSALDQPLSQWERFRARYLGAKPQYRVLPKDKKKPLARVVSAIKGAGVFTFCTPFLPTALAFAAQHLGYSVVSQQTVMLLFICDTVALFLGVVLRHLLNIFGVAAMTGGLLMAAVFFVTDNMYQNACQKLFNKNFKDYPLKNMVKNMEALNRRKNALRLHDQDLVLEMNFCVQNCEQETLKSVLAWCSGAPSLLQYRHLEELRAHVLHQFKNFSSYTEKLLEFQKEKNAHTAQKETEELLKLYALRVELENAILTCSEPQEVSRRRM